MYNYYQLEKYKSINRYIVRFLSTLIIYQFEPAAPSVLVQ